MSLHVLKPGHTTVAQDLRALADRIDAGDDSATSAIVVCTDRHKGLTMRTLCGERIAYSAWMGLLAYATQMLYAECRKEANDG